MRRTPRRPPATASLSGALHATAALGGQTTPWPTPLPLQGRGRNALLGPQRHRRQLSTDGKVSNKPAKSSAAASRLWLRSDEALVNLRIRSPRQAITAALHVIRRLTLVS